MNNNTERKNNTIKKSTISSTNKSSNKDIDLMKDKREKKEEKKTPTKKQSVVIIVSDNDTSSGDDDKPIIKKRKTSSKESKSNTIKTKPEHIDNNLDITKLAYEKINERYSMAIFLGLKCIMDINNGYINATKFCSSFNNGKTLNKYLSTERFKNLKLYLEEPDRYRSGSIQVCIKDNTSSNELRGTYFHCDLLLDVASWISPEAYFKASRIVNNHLIREKEYEIRKLTGDKCELVKMLEKECNERRESDKQRIESDKINKQLLLDMKLQNEKTHSKLDKTHSKLDKTKDILKQVEIRVEKIVEEVVPPTKQKDLHEQFGIMRLNDSSGEKHYKAYCSQTRSVNKAKSSIIKNYPQAVLLREVSPSPNSKNFLHQLKEKYGSGKKSKIKVSYNYINLNNITEEELNTMLDDVIESNKNYGN